MVKKALTISSIHVHKNKCLSLQREINFWLKSFMICHVTFTSLINMLNTLIAKPKKLKFLPFF